MDAVGVGGEQGGDAIDATRVRHNAEPVVRAVARLRLKHGEDVAGVDVGARHPEVDALDTGNSHKRLATSTETSAPSSLL